MLDDASRRRDFPSLAGITYLNTAAEGIPPPAVAEALARYAADKLLGMDGREPHGRVHTLARRRAAELLGLTTDDVALCSSSSEAFNLAALALAPRDGDEVVVNDLDFPAGATPWLQPSSRATVRVWRHRDGRLHTEDLARELSARTRLVTVSLVSFYNGFLLDLAATAAVVRRHSPALLAVDVTQALGRIPLDLSAADLVVSSTHKWILATHGGGIVGVPPHRKGEWTVPAGGWFHLEDAFGPDRFARAVSRPGAAGFAVGMPNYPMAYALEAALAYVGGIGVAAIDAHARPLVMHCLEGLRGLPVELLSPSDPGQLAGILAFRHPRAEAIHGVLHRAGIHVMHTAGRMRVAIHGYNTAADVERFLAVLASALAAV
ncbi:MAG: aminotransferase class V-fold PLP-dependent enzyme [Planctomycetia bacterium]